MLQSCASRKVPTGWEVFQMQSRTGELDSVHTQGQGGLFQSVLCNSLQHLSLKSRLNAAQYISIN